MERAWHFLPGNGQSHILAIVDHASNHVPAGIDLGISAALLETHIAIDIGAAELARELGYPSFLGAVSRLVIDFNREEDAANIIPRASDGHEIPGNRLTAAERAVRVDRFWRPYHARLESLIDEMNPNMLLSLHSFTPSLSSEPGVKRPWEVGVLYNDDDRAARPAIDQLSRVGIITGDQQPYSGKMLNATMNHHAERRAIPYLGLEVRQDLLSDHAGVAHWAKRLRPVIDRCAEMMAERQSVNARY